MTGIPKVLYGVASTIKVVEYRLVEDEGNK